MATFPIKMAATLIKMKTLDIIFLSTVLVSYFIGVFLAILAGHFNSVHYAMGSGMCIGYVIGCMMSGCFIHLRK